MDTDADVPDIDADIWELIDVITSGELNIEGRMYAASNATLACRATNGQRDVAVIYKPTRGERPLWDFPDGTLGRREVAAYRLASLMDLDSVPLTVWRDSGPLGPGMCQLFVEEVTDDHPVDIVPQGEIPPGFMRVLDAYGPDERPVT